jgi:hypothetical protein
LPFAVTINGFTLAPTTNEGSCSVVVIQDGVPGSIFSVDLQPVDTAIEIPAGTLQPATNYSIQVTYLNSLQTPNGGFGTAESGVGFLRGTAAHFTTLPANVPNHLGDMNCDDAVTVADIPLFVQALLATGAFGGCDINRADMNEDGLTNGRDTQPFVAVLLAL